MGQAERPADVLTVDDDLTQHGHDRGRWVVGGRGPGPEPFDEDRGVEGTETAGGPVGEDVETEAGGDQFPVEVRWGLLGGGQDVTGHLLDRPAGAE